MPNIYGLVNEGLNNPLTEDLQGSDYNIYDINELHINELHDQDGIDKIKVHEDFNMLNHNITNMADPVQNKDAATKNYVDNAVGGVIYYDLAAAFGDETTAISAGVQPMRLYPSRDFTGKFLTGSLSQVATGNNFEVQIKLNSTVIGTLTFLGGSPIATASMTSQTITTQQLITCECPLADSTASGLKVTINGEQI